MDTTAATLPIRQITTPRLLLRAATAEDATDLYECFSDPETMRYWSSLPHASISETETWVNIKLITPSSGKTDFVIVHQPTKKVIGKIGIWQGTEIGFIIGRKYWKQGIASECLDQLIPYFFKNGYKIITADVDPRNESSLALLKKFGFTETGREEKTFNVGGEWSDSVYLALEKVNWDDSQKQQSSETA